MHLVGGGGLVDSWLESANDEHKLAMAETEINAELINLNDPQLKQRIYKDAIAGATSHAHSK